MNNTKTTLAIVGVLVATTLAIVPVQNMAYATDQRGGAGGNGCWR